jgi:hypothetical protein
MSNQWFKFYGGDFLSDPKMEQLLPHERSCWLTLLCIASMNDCGEIEFLTTHSLLNKSGIYQGTDLWEQSQNILEKFCKLKMIDVTNDVTYIKNWVKRQEKNLTVSERVAKHRSKKAQNEHTSEEQENEENANEINEFEEKKEIVTSDVTIVTLEEKRREEKRREEKRREENINCSDAKESFDTFWKLYPCKIGRGKALSIWGKLDPKTRGFCIDSITKQNENNHFFKEWAKKDSPPYPVTWLNQERWLDEVIKIERKTGKGFVTENASEVLQDAINKQISL